MCQPRTPAASFKEKVDIVQAIVTIAAVVVGGFWTYDLFIKERREYPHANIEHKISHLALPDQTNLLRVGLEVTNAGSSLMVLDSSVIRVQQIVPPAPCANEPCATTQVKEALDEVVRKTDRFSWPLIGERNVSFAPSVEVEPGEKQSLDFEFVIPAKVKAVRVYTYFRNKNKSRKGSEIGWSTSSFYDFPNASGGEKK